MEKTPHQVRYTLLAVVLCAFALNWDFVLCHSLEDLPKREWDVWGLIAGYHQNPQILGGFDCWHGPWMYANTVSQFRPLASHFHWAQIWVGYHLGWFWVGWMTFVPFAAICTGAAMLSFRWTRSPILALLCGIAATGVRFYNPGHPEKWLAWFPVADFLLATAFLMWALVAFDAWLESSSRRSWVWVWALFGASALSKELGYIFPALAGAMALFHPRASASLQARCKAVGALLIATIALYLYRYTVLPQPNSSDMNPMRAVRLLARNDLWFTFASQQWAMLAFCVLLAGSIFAFWRFPRKATIYAILSGLALFGITTLPLDPGFTLEMVERPWPLLLRALAILMVPFGTALLLANPLGRMGLAVFASIHIPLLGHLHNQLFHYTIAPAFFLPVHLSVLAALMLPLLRNHRHHIDSCRILSSSARRSNWTR